MLSSDELEQLTPDELGAWKQANQTERLFMASQMKRKAYQRAIEKGVELNGKSLAQLKADFARMQSSEQPPPPATPLARAAAAAPTTNYGTARFVLGVMDVVGFLLIAAGVIVLLMMFAGAIEAATRDGFNIFSLLGVFFPPLGLIVTGIVIFAQGQLLRASLDTADATREILAHARLAGKAKAGTG